jgi:hypothetical protein
MVALCEHHARLSVTCISDGTVCQNFIQLRTGVLYRNSGASNGSVTIILNQHQSFFHPYFYTLWEIWMECGVERETRYRCWLKHCATNRMVAGSNPMWLLGFFIELILPSSLLP